MKKDKLLEIEHSCGDIHEKLIDYVCGELEASEALDIEQHIESCLCCQTELELLRSISDAVCTEHTPAVTESYWESFVVEVHQRIETSRRRAFPIWVVPVALAGIGLVVGVAYLLTRTEDKRMVDTGGRVPDSLLIRNIQSLSETQVESLIKHIVEIQNANRSVWEVQDVEPDRFRRLVNEQFLFDQ